MELHVSATTTEILTERAKTHGDYKVTAEIAVATKHLWSNQHGWTRLTATQVESLDMIASKVARILSGNPHAADHWADIQGYAQLVADELKQ
jgi:hypothetical protein